MERQVAHLKDAGYVIGTGKVELRSVLSRLGNVRDGGTLIPTPREDARRNSLSGVYGTGRFPWHTDGAVSNHAPKWIAMYSARPSTVPTEILEPDDSLLTRLRRTNVCVRARDGRTVVHRAAVQGADGSQVLRWDPRAAPPTNPGIVDIVEKVSPTGSVSWQADTFVIIDNHRLLHRRPPADAEPSRLLLRYYVD